ncbi:MAG: ABC transporter substrate-binding protein, partial [Halarsenatibacteraceae bacterium]
MKKVSGLLSLLIITALVLSFGFAVENTARAFDPDNMPEKPDKLSIIALDIDVEQFQEGVAVFEEKYGIEVEWLSFPYSELRNQITTSIQGGQTVDLVKMSNSWHPELGSLGMAVPLNDVVSEEYLAEINERYFDITVEFLSSLDKQWALPGNASSMTFFYNETMLNELGYQEPPETWDQMLKISREAIDAGLADYGFFPGYLANHEDGMVHFDIMLKLHDGQWMNDEMTEFTFNSEAGVKALTLMKEMLDEGIIPQASLEQSDWDNMHHFLAGNTPFEINWNFVLQMAGNPDQSNIVDDFAVGHIPGIERDTYTVLGGGGYAISPTTRSEEWAFMLLDYMHRKESALKVMRDLGGAEGTIKELYENSEDYGFTEEEYPMINIFKDHIEYGGLRPSDNLTWYSEFRNNIFTPAMHRALLGEQDVEEA